MVVALVVIVVIIIIVIIRLVSGNGNEPYTVCAKCIVPSNGLADLKMSVVLGLQDPSINQPNQIKSNPSLK